MSVLFKSDLSDREYKILSFIADYKRDHPFSPNIREIGAAIGVTSTSLIGWYLDNLSKGGYITREPRIARTINLTEQGRRVVVPRVSW